MIVADRIAGQKLDYHIVEASGFAMEIGRRAEGTHPPELVVSFVVDGVRIGYVIPAKHVHNFQLALATIVSRMHEKGILQDANTGKPN